MVRKRREPTTDGGTSRRDVRRPSLRLHATSSAVVRSLGEITYRTMADQLPNHPAGRNGELT
ncbi:hypothetical protein SLNWT_6535 [Streptomyces albus]|uniref:Uncharacterized protein n=1 Tax=Streptomyces albus (strain ATCC 21838 / DSM 41398 / FERM P-419 / JCM 4703 / NBRC 107858) TaxID=1081613 RepID=A0A0B5F7V9_STRA4|nr:hypothetical protein SLNWT_6535 [Streptomyces albus]AOU81216.1 hypothetical protein SLNHY_6525 [Streptomyces albus]